MIDAPWQWVSFADGSRPAGHQFLGVAIVRAYDVGHAAAVCWERGCNPGGEVMALEVPADWGDPPVEFDHKLVTSQSDIVRLEREWLGEKSKGCRTIAELEDEQ